MLYGKFSLRLSYAVMVIMAIVVFGHTNNTSAQTIVKIDAEDPDTGDLRIHWVGELYRDCTRKMKGHTKSSTQTQVCIVGNGDFSGASIRVVTERDWFPVHKVWGNRVSEVRLKCGLGDLYHPGTKKITPINSRIYYPAGSLDPETFASETSPPLQIELSCDLDEAKMKAEMGKLQRFIEQSIDDPEKTVKDVALASAAECRRKNASSDKCRSIQALVFALIYREALPNADVNLEVILSSSGIQLCRGSDGCEAHRTAFREVSAIVNENHSLPNSKVEPCGSLDLRNVPVGTRCVTPSSYEFELATRSSNGSEIWRDLTTGNFWGDRHPGFMSFKDAQNTCNSEVNYAVGSNFWRLPNKDDFDLADAHGFRHVIPNRDYMYWSSSFEDGDKQFSGMTGWTSPDESDKNFGSVRCVGQ